VSALSARLAPVQDALADLERECRAEAQAGNRPNAWAAWADLHAALMAIRAAQGRDARAGGYAADPPPAPCGGACRCEGHEAKGAA